MAVPVELSPRDYVLINLLINEHLSNKALAHRLGVSESVTCASLSSLYRRLHLGEWGDSRVRLVLWALNDGRFEKELPLQTYRIFTNDRGRLAGVPMYSALCDVEGYTPEDAAGKVNQSFARPPLAPIKAIEWPIVFPESRNWVARHT